MFSKIKVFFSGVFVFMLFALSRVQSCEEIVWERVSNGLPSQRIQALYSEGDALYAGTLGGEFLRPSTEELNGYTLD